MIKDAVKELWTLFTAKTTDLELINHENVDRKDELGDLKEYTPATLSPENMPNHLFPEYILTFIYLGLIHLRYPVFLTDVYRLVSLNFVVLVSE